MVEKLFMKKCRSCGEKFNPNFTIDVDEPDARLEEEIEEGNKCGECIFSDYAERQSMKGWGDDEDDYDN